MSTKEIHSTSLLEIRSFLADHECAPAPWQTPEQVIDHLYTALAAKNGDPEFWGGLQQLVEQLDDLDFDRTAFYGAKPFRGRSLADLIDELRFALAEPVDEEAAAIIEEHCKSGRMQRWLAGSISVAALTAFVLLGSAVGCTSDDDDNDDNDSNSGSNVCESADTVGIYDKAEANVYCQLVDIINSANISANDRMALLDCLPELDAAYRADLLQLFESMTDEEIAIYLDNTDNVCSMVNTVDDDTYNANDDDYWGDDDTWSDDDDH